MICRFPSVVLLVPVLAAMTFPTQSEGQEFPSGYFRLTTKFREGSKECLEGNQFKGTKKNGAAFMDTEQNVSGQLWKATPAGKGYYKLTTMFREGQKEFLEGNEFNGKIENGAAFMDKEPITSGQLWKAIPAGNGYFRLTTQLREGQNEFLEGNQWNGKVKNGVAFMDKKQDVTGQFWKAIPVTDAVVKSAAHHAKIVKLLESKGASTGDVEITLHWTNPNDLDLAVIDPSGERIYYNKKSSKSGGKLEFDANVGYDSKNTSPVEHIFWPKGQAPTGKYKIIVSHYKNHGKADCTDPTPYTVRLVVGGVSRIYQSELVFGDPKRSKQVEYEFNVP